MKPADFRFQEALRVRWVEVDLQKIVFNGHYLMYLDTAMAGYWRALALPYEDSMAHLAGDLFVRKATLEYHAPAQYDDQLQIGLRCDRVGSSSITFGAAVFRDGQLLVSGELVYVFADPVARRAQPVPASLRELMLGFEAGEPVLRVQTGHWSRFGEAASAIRQEVFVQEQQIPAELELDAADASAWHAVACNRLGHAVGTGRLLQESAGVGRIGRMAVRRALRGSGVGRALLNALVEAARARGDHEVCLHSQASAVAFYRRAGFEPVGPVFVEAGIEHQTMRLGLTSS